MASARKTAGRAAKSSIGKMQHSSKGSNREPDKIVVRFNPSIPKETLEKWEKAVKDYLASQRA
jgi:hypothetical protein